NREWIPRRDVERAPECIGGRPGRGQWLPEKRHLTVDRLATPRSSDAPFSYSNSIARIRWPASRAKRDVWAANHSVRSCPACQQCQTQNDVAKSDWLAHEPIAMRRGNSVP